MLPDLQAFLRAHRSAAQLGVYDGQRRVGTIIEVEGKALAFDAFGDALGCSVSAATPWAHSVSGLIRNPWRRLMAEVVPFPAVRRVAFIRKHAARMAGLPSLRPGSTYASSRGTTPNDASARHR